MNRTRSSTRHRRPSRRVPRSRGGSSWKRLMAIVGGVVGLIALVASIGLMVATADASCCDAEHKVAVVVQLDDESYVSSDELTDVALEAALRYSADGGEMTFYVASGATVSKVDSLELKVLRNGQPEVIEQVKIDVLSSRIGEAIDLTLRTPAAAGESGRDVTAPFVSLSKTHPTEIIYAGFGLSDREPLDARRMMGGDPANAIAALPDDAVPSLDGVAVTVLYASAAGSQVPLNTEARTFRDNFLREYLEVRGGARIVAFMDPNIGGEQSGSVSDANPIELPAIPTLEVLLDGATFDGDSTAFADQPSADRAIGGFAEAWKTGGYGDITCVGHTSVGPEKYPGFDNDLAAGRASAAGAILLALNVPGNRIITKGVGSSDPLPGTDPSDPVNRRVVCTAHPL